MHPTSFPDRSQRENGGNRKRPAMVKAVETSSTVRGIHLTLSPVTGEAASDLLSVTVIALQFNDSKPARVRRERQGESR